MAKIYLSGQHGKGKYALVDDDDFALYGHMKWHLSDTGYAVRRVRVQGKNITHRLHRLIADPSDDLFVDHINHDRLDNRRSNLRACTHSQNMRNKTNQGRGYWYRRQNKNWVVEVNGLHRGTFRNKKAAAEFASLVRAGQVDKKPRAPRTHCKHGHSLHDAYIVAGYKMCKPCQKRRSAEYFKRKRSKQLWLASQTQSG